MDDDDDLGIAELVMARLAKQDARIDRLEAELAEWGRLFGRVGSLCAYLGEAYGEIEDRSRNQR
jgi:hypothetical protein